MSELDEFDLKILGILQQEGRITTLQLAERVGLSPTPSARRVKRLEDEGYIDRYVGLLNPAHLGVRLNVFVSIRLRSQTRDAFARFGEEIKHMPEIVGCYLLTGNYDYLLQVRVADVDAFGDFMLSKLTAIEGVIETQSSIVLQELKATTEIPLTARS